MHVWECGRRTGIRVAGEDDRYYVVLHQDEDVGRNRLGRLKEAAFIDAAFRDHLRILTSNAMEKHDKSSAQHAFAHYSRSAKKEKEKKGMRPNLLGEAPLRWSIRR